ncbi:unnamed protein product [Hymenolepis diminuta]|uniref:C2H2-type domain-containing protein n=1 Tax=Hymenolepis diminuta TaxID=6216 RepID=A0A0R3SDU0_HYMDI|nr:unnamed protein product [Hymenolepis diminuta]VUZ42337.1 unnamed protein product [Hymenolepis diminuta]
MQSDVSVLTCTSQNGPHFMRGLKKESGVLDGSSDLKNVFLSQLGSKSSGFHHSFSYIQPEPQKVPLDSVDTLLRSKSYEELPSNSDNDLNELLQFVSERSTFSDEKPPVDSSNSFWLSNPSPPILPIKDEEPTKPTKLPAVDQIMKFHSRDPPSTGNLLYPMPQSSTMEKLPSFEQINFGSSVITTVQSVASSHSSEVSSSLSCKPLQSPQLFQSKCEETSTQSNFQYSSPQHRNWRSGKETESTPQKSQPRFILPNTSRPISTTTTTEAPVAKPTVLVPINNQSNVGGTNCGGSLLLLPLAVATALQQHKQQTNTVLAQIPSGTTQFLLIRTNPPTSVETPKPVTTTTSAVGIITPAKANVGISLLSTQSVPQAIASTESINKNNTIATTNIPQKPLPLSVSSSSTPVPSTAVALPPPPPPPVISIDTTNLKPTLAPALLPSSTLTPLLTKPRIYPTGEERNNSIISAQNAILTASTTTSVNMRRRHQCPYCTKSCERKDNLQAHIRTHTGERPFPCRFCPKAFPQKDHLRAHIRTHTGEKPYRCPQCAKAFAQLGNLHRHVKTHRQ